MFRRITCKFYPESIDGNKCFFVHEPSSTVETDTNFNVTCPNGQKCTDQSCKFSDTNHKDIEDILCKFQANCNRIKCLYKHCIERKSFLGLCQLKRKGK